MIKPRFADLNVGADYEIEIISDSEMLDRLANVIENFGKHENAHIKNQMLKSIIRRIDYFKTEKLSKTDNNSDLEVSVLFLI